MSLSALPTSPTSPSNHLNPSDHSTSKSPAPIEAEDSNPTVKLPPMALFTRTFEPGQLIVLFTGAPTPEGGFLARPSHPPPPPPPPPSARPTQAETMPIVKLSPAKEKIVVKLPPCKPKPVVKLPPAPSGGQGYTD